MEKRILIIDDSESKIKRTIDALIGVFGEKQYEDVTVDLAFNSNKGMHLTAKRSYDFVFVDMVLPDTTMSGLNSLGGIKIIDFLKRRQSLNAENIKYIINSAGEDTPEKLEAAGITDVGVIKNTSGYSIAMSMEKFIYSGLSEEERKLCGGK